MSRELKVGIFVLVGLLLTTLGVFVIGGEEHFWQSKVTYGASFHDVAGLKPGSPVQLGGVDVGTVSSVKHSHDASDTRIHVKLSIVRTEAVRLREGTVATIENKGLLGDKMLTLTVPDPAAPELPANGELKSEEPLDLSKYVEKIDRISETAQKVLNNIEAASRPFADARFSEDAKGVVSSLNQILTGVVKSDSAAHRLLLDPHEGERVDRLLADLDVASAQFSGAMADVHEVTTQVKTGPGLAHAVVYDGEVSKSAAGALSELHEDLRAIRQGNGLARAIIYGDDGGQHVMKNLDAMSDDLRQIVARVREGKGTLGGLLVDPSVYEDIKSAVGNVERNEVLRALVRYSLKADEERPRAQAAPAPSK
jgi:phospholipid/cholesterol/gamma-HCH transport system substrate-binding protein